MLKLVIKETRNFYALRYQDRYSFLLWVYKKVGDTQAYPMCSRMNHLAEVSTQTEVIGVKPSAYSRDREENMPDFEGLTWELQCQMAEMGIQ